MLLARTTVRTFIEFNLIYDRNLINEMKNTLTEHGGVSTSVLSISVFLIDNTNH